MDEQKIADVVLAEEPRFSPVPKSRMAMLITIYAFALLISTLLVAMGLRLKQTVETPWALQEICSAPVLGTVPVHSFQIARHA